MSYKIDNAIIKKDRLGNISLIDPQGKFQNDDAFVAIKSDDLITIQLLINAILKNDFTRWREIRQFPNNESVKSLLVRLGYSKDDIAQMLREL